MTKKKGGKKKPAGPKTPKTDEAVAVVAPQRSSDRLSADAPEWHPSSCFTPTAATIVENMPTPPVPTQADFSPVEAVTATSDSAAAAAAAAASSNGAVLDTEMPSSPEGEGTVDQMEREILVATPTPAATVMNASLPEENGVPHEASPAAADAAGATAAAAGATAAAAPVSTTSSAGVPIDTDAKSPAVGSREAGGDASAAATVTVDTAAGFPSSEKAVSAAATAGGSGSVFEAAPTASLSEEEEEAVAAAVEGGGGGGEEEGVAARTGAADAAPAEVSLTAEAIFKTSEDCARVAPSPAAASAGAEASFSRKDDDLLSTAAVVPAPPHEAAEAAAVTVVAAAETEATVVCGAEVVPTTDAATAASSTPDYPSLHDADTGIAGGTNGIVGGGGGGGGGGVGGVDGRSKAEEAFYRGAAKGKLGAPDGEESVPDAESTDEATDRTEDGGSECFDPAAPSKGDVDHFFSIGNGGKGGGENGKSSKSGGSGKGLLANPTLRWGIAALAAVVVVAVGVSRGRRPR